MKAETTWEYYEAKEKATVTIETPDLSEITAEELLEQVKATMRGLGYHIDEWD